jgi:hypothetical protein
MYEEVYGKHGVPILLPTSTLVDMEGIYRLHSSGFIDTDTAAHEISGVTGLQIHRFQDTNKRVKVEEDVEVRE